MKLIRWVVTCLVVMLGASNVFADQISLGGTAAIAAGAGATTLWQGETQSLGTGSDVWMYLHGSSTSTQPVLLIVGIPNDPAAPNAGQQLSASSITGYKLWNNSLTTSVNGNPVGFSGTNPYSSFKNTTHNKLGFAGDFNSGDLYQNFFGITSITASQQFQSNWQAYDQHLFPSLFPPPAQPVNFGIYVFALSFNGAQYSSKGDDFIEVNFGTALPVGTYAVGYSQVLTTGKKKTTNPSDNFTPFTVSGLVNETVPEPGGLLTFGTAFGIAIGFLRRRRSA